MTTLTDRILVGVDTGADARHLVRVAAALAGALGAELHLVHVRLARSTVQGRPMTPAQRETGQHEAETLLATLAEEAEEAEEAGSAPTRTHVRFGEHIERELARAQEQLEAGLLVIGSSRRGGVARRLLGTPSSGAVRRSPGSVLVVREPAGEPGNRL
jgi:nucleotide-binding universal stress UspA family protein